MRPDAEPVRTPVGGLRIRVVVSERRPLSAEAPPAQTASEPGEALAVAPPEPQAQPEPPAALEPAPAEQAESFRSVERTESVTERFRRFRAERKGTREAAPASNEEAPPVETARPPQTERVEVIELVTRREPEVEPPAAPSQAPPRAPPLGRWRRARHEASDEGADAGHAPVGSPASTARGGFTLLAYGPIAAAPQAPEPMATEPVPPPPPVADSRRPLTVADGSEEPPYARFDQHAAPAPLHQGKPGGRAASSKPSYAAPAQPVRDRPKVGFLQRWRRRKGAAEPIEDGRVEVAEDIIHGPPPTPPLAADDTEGPLEDEPAPAPKSEPRRKFRLGRRRAAPEGEPEPSFIERGPAPEPATASLEPSVIEITDAPGTPPMSLSAPRVETGSEPTPDRLPESVLAVRPAPDSRWLIDFDDLIIAVERVLEEHREPPPRVLAPPGA